MLQPLHLSGLEKPLSRLVQGTLHLPRLETDAVERLLDAAFEFGVTAFDTAPVYGSGLAEQRLGAWLAKRRLRDHVVLIGKGCHPDGTRPRMNGTALHDDLCRSLERLEVDHFDVYLLHRDDPREPVAPIVEALNREHMAGRVRSFGASNWSWSRVEEANLYATHHGLRPFSLCSPGLSLAHAERSWPGCVALSLPHAADELARYRAAAFPLLAWSPLAGGYLTLDAKSAASEDAARANEFYDSDDGRARRERAILLARDLGVSVAALSLAYVFSLGLDVSCVLGCRDGTELSDCKVALELELSVEQCRWLEMGR